MYSERRAQAVSVRARVGCGEHYDALASCIATAVETLPASQTAGEGSPHANQAVRARVVELGHALQAADSLTKRAGGELAALGIEVALL